MKKLILLWSLLLCSFVHYGQLSLQPVLPSVGLIQKDQLWNVLVINSSAIAIDANIELVVRDRMYGNDVLAASATQIHLPVGARQLNVNSVGLIQYNYLSAEMHTGFNGFLPVGSYLACYSILTGEDKTQLAATECVQFDIEPLNPPMLVFPRDSAVLDIDPKQFIWIPPAPPDIFSSLNYEIIIAEISGEQKPDEAIQNNMPLVYETSLATNTYLRSQAFNTMEAGRWYAWQVIARNRNQYAGKSETWVFRYDTPLPLSDFVKATPYVVLRRENPEQAVAPDGYVKMIYHNRLSDTSAIIEINEMSGESGGKGSARFEVKLRRGDNQIQYYIPRIIKPDVRKVYKATLLNSIGEKWTLIFKVKYFKN